MRNRLISFISLLFIIVFTLPAFGQKRVVTGIVKDEVGPIPYATVSIDDTDFVVVTDIDGNFVLNNLPRGSYYIKVSSLGYKTHTEKIEVNGKSNGVELEVMMNEDLQMLDEVVVTGVSKATIIRENPIPVTALSYEEVNHNPQSNIIDALLKSSSGLTVLKTGPNISKPFIRGLGYNRVLTLYDGVRQEGQQWGDEHGLEIDDYNVGRAEVIKGPSSLMYGSDAIAGVISFFPNVPDHYDNKLHGSYVGEYHNNNNMIGNGLRLGYNNEKYLFAINGSHRIAQNYQNPIDGRVYMTNFNEVNFGALAGIKSDRGYTHFNFTLYDNKQGIPDGSRDEISRKFTKQIFEDDEDDDDNREIVSDKELKSYKITDIHTRIQHYRLYVNSSYELSKGDNISASIAGQQNVRREYNHPTMPDQEGMYVRLNTLNYDVRYNAPSFSNIETTYGVNGMWQENEVLDATEIPIPDYLLFDFGAFAYAKWKRNAWTVSGGLRYDLRHEKWDDFYTGIDPETGFIKQVDANASDAFLQFPKFNKNFHDISASIGATYRINREISLKASIGRAFRAPNITELASNGLDPGAAIYYKGDRDFKPEVSIQQDLGISAKYKDVSGEVSLFHNNINNFIYLQAQEGEDGTPKTDNSGNRYYDYKQSEAEMFGGEAWISVHPQVLKGLRFFNSVAFAYGFNRDSQFKNKGNSGEYLPLIAPVTINSDLSYEFETNRSWIKTIKPNINVEFAGKQDRYLALSGTETFTPSYTLVNMGVSASIPYSKDNSLQLMLQANNVFDKAYQSHLSRLKYLEDHDGPGIYNMGRNVIMKIILPFG